MTKEFKVGDLVWAKMKTYAPWPGRVTAPNSQSKFKKPAKKGDYLFIYFFGSKDYAWIEYENIKDYLEYKDKFITSIKSRALKNAVSDIEEYIKRREENPEFEPEEEQVDSEFNRLKDSDSEQEVTPKKVKRESNATKRSASKSTPTNSSSKKRKTEKNGSSPSTFTSSIKHFREVLNRPSVVDLVEAPKIDINNVSENLKSKNIEPSSSSFGFLGLGIMGSGIVKNLINSGHTVNIYTRSKKREDEIIAQSEINHPGKVRKFDVPSDVVQHSDIIFCCVSDPTAVKDMIYGTYGLLHDVDSLDGKGYVEMSTIDPETSIDMSNLITNKGGRYLEAQIQGSKTEANDGNLIILGAGDITLFYECKTCFKAIAKAVFHLGEVGFGCKMNLALQVMKGVALAGVAEGFALADRSGISAEDVMEIFNLTGLNCPYLKDKVTTIINTDFQNVKQSVQNMQKDLRLAIQLADSLMQPLILASTANEVFKHVKRLGYEAHDASAVYMRSRY